MKVHVFILLLALTIPPVAVWAAPGPVAETAVPIYGGAIEDKNAAGQFDQEDPVTMFADTELILRSKSNKVYSTNSPVEDVFRFYLQKLGAESNVTRIELEQLFPGKSTPVEYEVIFYESEFRDLVEPNSGTVIRSGKMVRNSLASRQPYQPEKWIKEATFLWEVREENEDLTGYAVIIYDKSFSEDYKTYKTKTWIVVTRQTYQSEEDSMNQKIDEDSAATLKTMKQPTERELGAPIYPGSIFNKEASAGMSLNEDQYYIFLSNDLPEKVASFYQQKLGKQALNNQGKYLIALKGNLPWPDNAISIEPNTLGGAAKTMITFKLSPPTE
ncbi:MAG TPA: hypothetical protein VF531_08850 [Bacillota bacterium]